MRSYIYGFIAIIICSLLIIAALVYVRDGADDEDTLSHGVAQTQVYTNITGAQLDEMLKTKDFKLVDVHIPEQDHISGTDKFIPYNDMDAILEYLPDKNEKIVLYCRSGNMSEEVARRLMDRGYTNVYNLYGGVRDYSGPIENN